jgi:chromosome segregation ATPase
MSQRLKIMKGHFKNVQQELDHTNELNVSKTAEMKTEKHLRQLTSRAVGQNQAETKKLQLDLEMVQDELSLVQSNIHKSNEKMDEFKMKMNWNQEELERWAIAAKQKEDDTNALEKYTRADESKIKDINLMIEHLTKEKMKKSTVLDNEKLETLTKQIELDRIADEFKKLHIDRQELVSRWQDAIGEIKKRDWEINSLGERFAVAKTERVKKEAKVASQAKRLERQLGENKEVESRTDGLGRNVSRKREEMMTGSLKLQEFRDELESLKNELTIAAESLIARRSQNVIKSQANDEKKIKLERERFKYKQVKTNFENSKNVTLQAEELASQAELELQVKFMYIYLCLYLNIHM